MMFHPKHVLIKYEFQKHRMDHQSDNNNNNNNNNNNDSVPHSWILKTLEKYRFNEKLPVIKFMETSMSNWKTTMKLSYNDGCITTDQIKIKRGIFQGHSFSPLLFPLCR